MERKKKHGVRTKVQASKQSKRGRPQEGKGYPLRTKPSTEEFTKPTEIASNLTNWKRAVLGMKVLWGVQYYQQKIKKVSNQVDVLRK
jgi:hypothetical protein